MKNHSGGPTSTIPHKPTCRTPRSELKARFEGKPWLDVLSKADLLEEEFDEADERLAERAEAGGEGAGPIVCDAISFVEALPHAQRVSAVVGCGIDGLKEAMLRMLKDADLRSTGEDCVGMGMCVGFCEMRMPEKRYVVVCLCLGVLFVALHA
jgi:hypothetical protein